MAGSAVRIFPAGLGIRNLNMDCLTNVHGVPIFLVHFTRIILGRASTNSIWIDSADVSRAHATIQKIENGWQIKDANSTNGVFINDHQITPGTYYKLVRGDVISLGPPTTSFFKYTLNNYDAVSIPSTYFKVPCRISHNGMIDEVVTPECEDQNQVEVLRTYAEEYKTLMHTKNVPKSLQDENAFLRNEIAQLQAKLALNVAVETENRQLRAQMKQLKDAVDQMEQIEVARQNVVTANGDLQRLLKEADLKQKCIAEVNEYLGQEVHGFQETIKGLLTSNNDLQQGLKEANLKQKRMTEVHENLEQEVHGFQETIKNLSTANADLQRRLKEADSEQKCISEVNEYLGQEVHGFQETIKDLLTKNSRLQREKMEMEMRYKHQIAETLNSQIELQKQFYLEKDRIMKNKTEIETQAKRQVADALNSQIELQQHFQFEKDLLIKDKMQVEKNLLLQIEDFHKKLDLSDRKVQILRSELFALHLHNEQALCNAHRQISDIMEAEMLCSICSELFYDSVTLGCTHSFCHNCITLWKREQAGCPICRANIISITRCPVMDNFIESMVLNLSPDEIKHRESVRQTRLLKVAS